MSQEGLRSPFRKPWPVQTSGQVHKARCSQAGMISPTEAPQSRSCGLLELLTAVVSCSKHSVTVRPTCWLVRFDAFIRRAIHPLVTQSGAESEHDASHPSRLWKRTEQEERRQKLHMPRGKQMLQRWIFLKRNKAGLIWEFDHHKECVSISSFSF